MAVERVSMVYKEILDEPGALREALAALADAGLNLHAAVAHECGGGRAKLYALPKPGQRPEGFTQTDAIVLTGDDRVGSGARALVPLAEAGVNLRACFAIERQGEMVMVLVPVDIDAALAALR